MKMNNKHYYKIVDIENDQIKTLFHGLGGSRVLPINKWLTATKKMVSDGKGTTKYLSGFHIMESLDDSINYLKKFKNIENKAVLLVSAKNIWKKEHSTSNVWLCEKMKIHSIAFQYEEPKINGVGDLITYYYGINPGYYMTLPNKKASKLKRIR